MTKLILPIFLCFVAGCIREIDLKTETGNLETLVVEGDFTNSVGSHRVVLSKPNRYGISVFERIAGAKISISDDLGQSGQYFEKKDSLGTFYELPAGTIAAQPDRRYQLSIELPDGKKFISQKQKMPVAVKMDSVWLEGRIEKRVSSQDVVVEEQKAIVKVKTTLPDVSSEVFLRWEAHCVYFFPELSIPVPLPPPTKKCYIYEYFNAQNTPIQQVSGQGRRELEKEIGSKFIDYAFDFSAYFTVVQRSISAESFVFYKNVGQISNPAGTIFDPPPGAIRGNIFNENNPSEFALGFFEVAAVDTIRLKVFNGYLGWKFQPPVHCENSDYYFNRNSECFDCLKLKNSTLTKPFYWK